MARGTRIMLQPMSSVERAKAPQGAPRMPSAGMTLEMHVQLFFNRKRNRKRVEVANTPQGIWTPENIQPKAPNHIINDAMQMPVDAAPDVVQANWAGASLAGRRLTWTIRSIGVAGNYRIVGAVNQDNVLVAEKPIVAGEEVNLTAVDIPSTEGETGFAFRCGVTVGLTAGTLVMIVNDIGPTP